MKKESTSPTQDAPVVLGSASDRGRLIGLGIVVAIIVLVTAWMYAQGRDAIAAPNRAAMLPVQPATDDRFDDQQWFLAREPLLGFVEIPAGGFAMGSDATLDSAAYANERWSQAENQGRVELPTFYISRYEVTVAQYAAFVNATNRAVPEQAAAPANHPVTNVAWTDALAYARWLELQLAQSQISLPLVELVKQGWHFSLPSEAQWEKAARGTDGRVFPWGNSPDDTKANFGRAGVMPVGSFTCGECAFGLADMSGNVWELTRSPFQPYPYAANDEPREAAADALFVMRGGAFNDPPNNVRAAIRGGIDPGARRPFIGFRLVLEKSAGS
jgi:formylglycine-generating enzyme required for sulfatase activity